MFGRGLPGPAVGGAGRCLHRSEGGPGRLRPELKSFLKARLSPFKVPKEYVVLKELPKGSTGKILKPGAKRDLRPPGIKAKKKRGLPKRRVCLSLIRGKCGEGDSGCSQSRRSYCLSLKARIIFDQLVRLGWQAQPEEER